MADFNKRRRWRGPALTAGGTVLLHRAWWGGHDCTAYRMAPPGAGWSSAAAMAEVQ